MLLARDVLDKQLIDVDGKRVVRVNDVQLIEAAGDWRVTARREFTGTIPAARAGGFWERVNLSGARLGRRRLSRN